MPASRPLLLPPQGLLPRGRLSAPRCAAGLLGLGLLGVLGALGCGHDTTGPAPRDPATLPWTLTLNHHAVTLSDSAPYDTAQLTATARTVSGAPLAGAVVRYTTTDPSSAVVDTTGLVTARGVTNQVLVIATATVADVTVADTVAIRVNDVGATPVLPEHLVLTATQNPLSPFAQPVPPPDEGLTIDCANFYEDRFSVNMRSIKLGPQVVDRDGTDITAQTVIDYRSSDPGLLAVEGPVLFNGNSYAGRLTAVCAGGRVGAVTITATATVYGMTVQDAIHVTVIPTLRAVVLVSQRTPAATHVPVNYFDPGTVTIGVGGIVLWRAAASALPQRDSTDVFFDVPNPTAVARGVDPAAMGTAIHFLIPYPFDTAGGNIAPFVPVDPAPIFHDTISYRARQFPMPGTYHYHSRYGTTGTIVVRPWTS